jgi:hypothetical protein
MPTLPISPTFDCVGSIGGNMKVCTMKDRNMKSEPPLVALEKLAMEVFVSTDDIGRWFAQPHPLLNGETPFQMATTEAGAERVRSLLVAIKYGGVA